MKNLTENKLLLLLWAVIAVLVLGGGTAVYMAVTKADSYKNQLNDQSGNLKSLREQVRQFRNPTPVPGTPLPEASSNLEEPVKTPAPTKTPASTPTPAPTSTPTSTPLNQQ